MPSTMTDMSAAGQLESKHSSRIRIPLSAPEGQRSVFYLLSLDWSCPEALKAFMDFSVKSLAIVQDGEGSELWAGNWLHNPDCVSACDSGWMISHIWTSISHLWTGNNSIWSICLIGLLQGTEGLIRFIYVKTFKSLKSMYVYKLFWYS